MKINNLGEVIKFNSSFKTAVNLYLSLNKTEKVLNYIPTKSSIRILDEYLDSINRKKDHATLLVGPYGKGKSHLLLVLLAILSLERNEENAEVVSKLMGKIKLIEEIGEKSASDIEKAWSADKYLPVIINDTTGNLNQDFLVALDDALKRDGLVDLIPDTYYSEALKRIDEWENNYPDTYSSLKRYLQKSKLDAKSLCAGLRMYSADALEIFERIYPSLTAGSSFNPLATSEVVPLYKSVSEKLVEDHGYSGIYIVFDEFSKFIEGIDGTNAGNTMKLLQDVCELANESSNAQIYITMVAHKSIKEYGKYLSSEIINAFTGIDGRIQEKFFVTSSKNNYELIRSAIEKDLNKIKEIPGAEYYFSYKHYKEYLKLPAFSNSFNQSDFESVILKGCFPLTPIASYLLLNVSEKVAQNERTLFTFISNDEPYSLARYVKEHDDSKDWFIGADLIYDYFSGLFKKEVSNELVHSIWLGAEYALTKCQDESERKVIKTLALLLIVNKVDEMPANEKILSLASNVDCAVDVIDRLVDKQIIYNKSSIDSFVFKTRAGVELKAELKKQRELKGSNCNYAASLQEISGRYYIIPRRYNTEKMMTRYFRHEYMDVESFMSISDSKAFFKNYDTADGKVIALYGLSKFKKSDIKNHFKELDCKKMILVIPSGILGVTKELRDYEILEKIKSDSVFMSSNEVLKKEIPLLKEDLIKAVEDDLDENYSGKDSKIYYWKEDKIITGSSKEIEEAVNQCCEKIYYKTPVINNEIINRTNISTAQTRKARLNIIDAILKHVDTESFYSGTNQEATIYRALFGKSEVAEFDEEHIEEIKGLINEFVNACSDQKLPFTNIISKLIKEPYGMRLGVIPIYLAKVLSERNEDIIAYFTNMEVTITPEIIVNMVETPTEYSLFVSKKDLQKEEYLRNLNELFSVNENRALTENRIKNVVLCMQRWFRALPQVARNLAGIEEYSGSELLISNMKMVRKLMQQMDVNPYEILFLRIPEGFGSDDYVKTIELLTECKLAYDNYLIDVNARVIKDIYKIWGNPRNKDLYHVLHEWYEKQSDLSKQGLHSGSVTNLMTCIEKLDVYADEDVAERVVKAVSNVYIENWLDNAERDFILKLGEIKTEVEHIKEEKSEGKFLLSFNGSNGEQIERYYEKVDEGTGMILRNIIEDTLDEFDDLSVNDRVAILLEMIERTIG